MPRFYFHQHLNGEMAEDRRGRKFASADEACAHAVYYLTPAVLRKTASFAAAAANTYLATEVSDGKRTLWVVRATVIIERR